MIDEYHNNCGMVAFRHVLPNKSEQEIIEACLKGGFTEWLGMLPHHIALAAKTLGLNFHIVESETPKTLATALAETYDKTCLIQVTGHVIASHMGKPIDTNQRRRGSRRNVLRYFVLHNATITRRTSWDVSRDPVIAFVHDVRNDTRKHSSKYKLYEQVLGSLDDPFAPVRFSELQSMGYDRKLLKRHIERGDVVVLEE